MRRLPRPRTSCAERRDASRAEPLEPEDRAQQRGLARAARTEHGDELAGLRPSRSSPLHSSRSPRRSAAPRICERWRRRSLRAAPRQRLDVRLHPREVSLALGERFGELDDRDAGLGLADRPRVVSAPPVCAFAITTRTSPSAAAPATRAASRAATSWPSSTASLKASGVDVLRPAASTRYTGTGSVTKTFAPACAGVDLGERALEAGDPVGNASGFAVNASASSGLELAELGGDGLARASPIVCGSYQTCSLKPSMCSWSSSSCAVRPRARPSSSSAAPSRATRGENSTAVITGAVAAARLDERVDERVVSAAVLDDRGRRAAPSSWSRALGSNECGSCAADDTIDADVDEVAADLLGDLRRRRWSRRRR